MIDSRGVIAREQEREYAYRRQDERYAAELASERHDPMGLHLQAASRKLEEDVAACEVFVLDGWLYKPGDCCPWKELEKLVELPF